MSYKKVVLETKSLYFKYDEKIVLRDLNIMIEEGSFVVLLGRNGSGKSTLLKLFAGLLKPTGGNVKVYGENVNKISYSKRAKLIGFLPQSHSAIFPYTVEEVVLTGRASYILFAPQREDKLKAYEAMERVGILELKDQPYNQLSGGERQLVMIARILTQEPKIVLFDEPLTFLDIYNQIRFFSLVKEILIDDVTVVMVIHDLLTAIKLNAKYLMLSEGQLVAQGSKEIFTSENIFKVFNINVKTADRTGEIVINLF